MKKYPCIVLVLALSLALMLAACSSGGGSGATTPLTPTGTAALTVTESVSVVEPKITAALAGVRPLLLAVSVPADSDYVKDPTHVYVEERSVEGFRTINEILCMVSQTKYDAMLNSGPYVALIDQNKCSSNKGDASTAAQESQNQSSGTDAPRYIKWAVNVTRADNNSPEYLSAWIHEPAQETNGDPSKIVFAKMTITEGKSDVNPIGIFVINFRAVDAANPAVELFKGFLKAERDPGTGKILLKLASDNAQWQATEQATLDKGVDPVTGAFDGTGKGKVHTACTNTQNQFDTTTDIAYNADFFLRSEGANSVCLDRNTFDHSAWSYGLYDNVTGARINRDSGFSINTQQDGTGYFGWVGYWGVWLDNSAPALTNNQTVYNIDYRTRTATTYNVFLANGRLKKHTKNLLTLGAVKGVPMDYWEQNGNGGSQFRVVWDPVTLQFNKVAEMLCNGNTNCTWSNLQSPLAIDIAHLPWGELNFWSQSLGGQVRVPLSTQATPCTYVSSTTGPGYTDCSAYPPSNATPIVFYKEDIVYPNDAGVPGSLACYDNCLKATSNGVDPLDPFAAPGAWDPATGQQVSKSYAFDAATLDLKDGQNSVVSNTTDSMNQWGYGTGALFEASTANMDQLKCDWDATQVCAWKAWSVLPVFYTWETGPNTWNRFTGLKDANGIFKNFQPPLQVKYVKTDGTTYMLEYAGFGQLQGIPGKCVNMDTGADTDCSGGGAGIRWVPEFYIPAGETVADEAAAKTYLVKPLEMEQRMTEAAAGSCSSLTIGTYSLPTMADWVAPGIGQEPVITDPPAVIGGTVQ